MIVAIVYRYDIWFGLNLLVVIGAFTTIKYVSLCAKNAWRKWRQPLAPIIELRKYVPKHMRSVS